MIRKIWYALIIIIMAGAGVAIGAGLARVQANDTELDRAWAEIGELRDGLAQANDDRAAQGLDPVAVPDVVTEDPAGLFQGRDGKPGRPGADAPPPSATQVLAGVAAFCAPRVDCTGPMGPVSTTPGPGGADGAKGDPGESTTGDTGATGPGGPAGRGIASGPDCLEDGSWLTTYTDGSTFATPGPCRLIPEPDPTPTTPTEVAP